MSEGVFPTQHWAGLLPASDSGDKYLFYWLFAPDTSQGGEKADSDIPLIVWVSMAWMLTHLLSYMWLLGN